MNYTNFRKVVKDLQAIANNHKQINSFGIGTIEQMIYLTQEVDKKDNTENYKPPIYPLMFVIPQPSTVSENFMEYSLNIVISDIMNAKNYDTQVDLWSETYQMAQDVIAQYKYSVDQSQGDYESKYDINLPITCTPFSEGFDDLLVGWSFLITLQIDQPLNRCIAPFDTF
jgi:hypothetical protein